MLRSLFFTLVLLPGIALPASQGAGDPQDTGFHLRGVLVSHSGRSALINGRIAREGERVAGVDIVSIHEDGVRVRRGNEEFSVPVGARAAAGPRRPPGLLITRHRPGAPIDRSMLPDADSDGAVGDAAGDGPRRPVRRGDTLAAIAAEYAGDGISREQVMRGIFAANPGAFGKNVDVIYAGSALRIPTVSELKQLDTQPGSAERLARASDPSAPPATAAKPPGPMEYGPVRAGDTLSAIASRLRPAGVSLDQMMMGIFAANPEAFRNNINRLKAGATLDIPDGAELRRQPAAVATAEVQRQVAAWMAERRNPLDESLLAARAAPIGQPDMPP